MGEKGNTTAATLVGAAGDAVKEHATSSASATVVSSAGEAAEGFAQRILNKAQDRTVERVVDRAETRVNKHLAGENGSESAGDDAAS